MRKEVVSQILQTRKELMEGHTFVTDSDIAVLDIPTVARAVELRLTLAGLLDQAVAYFQYARMLDEQQIAEALKDQICNAVLAGARIGYAMKYLTARCEFYLNRGRLDAIKSNLFV